jgi:hypothetical protein
MVLHKVFWLPRFLKEIRRKSDQRNSLGKYWSEKGRNGGV